MEIVILNLTMFQPFDESVQAHVSDDEARNRYNSQQMVQIKNQSRGWHLGSKCYGSTTVSKAVSLGSTPRDSARPLQPSGRGTRLKIVTALVQIQLGVLDRHLLKEYTKYMKLFGLTFRSPIVKYAEIDLEEDLYDAIRASIIEDIVAEMEEETRHNIEVIKLFGPRA